MVRPEAGDMATYVAVLKSQVPDSQNSAACKALSERSRQRVVTHAITCLFGVHQYDDGLMRAFALHGGMAALTDLLVHPNELVQGEVHSRSLFGVHLVRG
jgi:hypothetical protein